jgi:hypothetical protein
MATFGYVVDQGRVHLLTIARGGVELGRVRRAFLARAGEVIECRSLAEGRERPLAELLVGEIEGAIVEGNGLDDWRSGEVDLVAGDCARCGEVAFAVCLESSDDSVRFNELRDQDELLYDLFDGVISEVGSGRWMVHCLFCMHRRRAGRRSA